MKALCLHFLDLNRRDAKNAEENRKKLCALCVSAVNFCLGQEKLQR